MKKCANCNESFYAYELKEGLCENCHEEKEERFCQTKPVRKRLGHARKVFGR